MRIGIDFDNTIITYDEVFCATAKNCGLLEGSLAALGLAGIEKLNSALRCMCKTGLTCHCSQACCAPIKAGRCVQITPCLQSREIVP